MSVPELYGLVLSGGRSRRMQRDKATLPYDGQPQLARAMTLLSPRVARAFVSIRADQLHDPQRAAFDTIADVHTDIGPIGGIHAALQAHPQHAWLILACDLPFLDATTLQELITGRDPSRLATAFRSSFDGKPEPLCAIFEPGSLVAIDAWIAQGHRCPRAFLAQADVEMLTLSHSRALDNINTADEYRAAAGQLAGNGASHDSPAHELTVRYFALLREQAGRSSEQLRSHARTPLQLYAELQSRRGLTLEPQFLRVAINDEFRDWQTPLTEGDTVVFLPPVAGG